MKFRYTGDLPIKDVDLVLGGVFKPNQSITKGTEFEVPDNNALLIQRVKLNGFYEVVPESKPKKFKKEIKKEIKTEEKKKQDKKEEK